MPHGLDAEGSAKTAGDAARSCASALDSIVFLDLRHDLRIGELVRAFDRNDAL